MCDHGRCVGAEAADYENAQRVQVLDDGGVFASLIGDRWEGKLNTHDGGVKCLNPRVMFYLANIVLAVNPVGVSKVQLECLLVAPVAERMDGEGYDV